MITTRYKMAYGTRVWFEPLRELAFGSIGAAYTAIGTGTVDYTRLFTISNSTDVDVYISLDGSTDNIRLSAGSAKVFDLTANKVQDDGFFIKKTTVFYVKRTAMGAPTTGSVWVEVMAAEGGK